ncbi:MAG: hypothetical protein PHY47_26240 [Lachnospiraceae bacterium]|nr:hypothetical protein [Lachnospiraceae bacterium]
MRLVILGSGGYGKTVAEQLGYEINFLDDSIPEHPLLSFTYFIASTTNPTHANTSPEEVEKDEGVEFIPAFGNNAFRLEWIERIVAAGGQLATLIHPTAYISPTATVAPGTVILPHAIINTDTVIERGCIINLGAIVDHGCIIEEGVHICVGAIVKGENRIERLTKIEAGEVIEPRRWPITT